MMHNAAKDTMIFNGVKLYVFDTSPNSTRYLHTIPSAPPPNIIAICVVRGWLENVDFTISHMIYMAANDNPIIEISRVEKSMNCCILSGNRQVVNPTIATNANTFVHILVLKLGFFFN